MSNVAIAVDMGGSHVDFGIVRDDRGVTAETITVQDASLKTVLPELEVGILVLVTLGTGIGGAVMLGGKLLQSGGHKAGGLAGHLGGAWNGRVSSCGDRGCAEAEASTSVLDAVCREREGFAISALADTATAIDFHGLLDAADAGDALALEVVDRCVGVWSALTGTLIHAYNARVIVFGGGVMRRHEATLPRIREHLDRHAWAEKGSVKIVPTALGSSAALLGALPLLRGRV